jgi:hypothetical protein
MVIASNPGTRTGSLNVIMFVVPLGRPRRTWVDNIKLDLREIGWDGVDRIDLAQDRDHWRALVNTVKNLRVPYKAGKFLSSCTTGGFARRVRLHEWVNYVCCKLLRLLTMPVGGPAL